MTRPSNPPAFPMSAAQHAQGGHFEQYGMDLRDHYAGLAMHAELVSAGSFKGPAEALVKAADEAGQTIHERIAFLAHEVAEAMLVERDRRIAADLVAARDAEGGAT